MSSPFDQAYPIERAGLALLPNPPCSASKQPTKTRICRQKSKTGCTTCKSRRVKCGEEKPACKKCTDYGRRCDGYNYRAKPKPKWLQGITLSTGSAGLSRVNAPPPLSLSPSISTFIVPNQREHYCFNIFKTKTVHELAGGQESKLWHEIVLHACNTHDAARHAAIAIAALSNSTHAPFIKSEEDYSIQNYSGESVAWRSFAIKQLGKAIAGLLELVSKGNGAVRASLIVSLLIYCFENAIGDPQAGIYIYNAMKIMYAHPAISNHPGHNLLVNSPAPEVFEDELVTTYTRLALNLTTRSHNHDSLRTNFLDMIMVDSPMPPMPRAFRDLAEAEEHLEYVLYETLPKRQQSPQATLPRRLSADEKYLTTQSNDFSVQAPPRRLPPTIFTTGSDNSSFNRTFQQWEGAFSPIFNHARGSEGSPDLIPAIILRIKALNVSLIGQGVFLPHKNQYGFIPSFLEILKLCRLLLYSPDFPRNFVFNFGVIPSLFAIVYTSLDPRLREEAVSILGEMAPRCEGTWSAARVAAMGELNSGTMVSEQQAQDVQMLIPPSPYGSGSDESLLGSPPLIWPQSAVCSRPLWQQDWGTRSASG